MKRLTILLALAAALFTSTSSLRLAAADDHGHSHDHAGHSHGEIVAYRATEWRQMHFEDPNQAAQHLKAVKDLGCEARQENHNGHIDVVYRCPTWREVPVQTHQLAEQWITWMKGAGFDVHHPHVDEQFLHGDEVIEVRLAEWKQVHLEGRDANQAREFSSTLQKMGSEVRSQNHGDHVDLAFRCPTWVAIHVPTHDAAEQWQAWLKSHGYETKHSH